jgi:hypothetical protein
MQVRDRFASRPSQGRIDAVISMKRIFTAEVIRHSVTTSDPVSGRNHISVATNCDAPANMNALISVASNNANPFCAANAPYAVPNKAITGIAGTASRVPAAKPARVRKRPLAGSAFNRR